MNIKLYVPLVMLSLFSGCARYRSKPLHKLGYDQFTRSSNKDVTFSFHAFSIDESKKFLGKDVIKAGYQPVHITLVNTSSHYLSFSPDRISLPTVSAEKVAKTVYDSTAGRAVGWGIAGLIVPIFLIPAIVDSSWSYEANQQLELDYMVKGAQEKLIGPNMVLNGVIFVPVEDYKDLFTITLIDEESSEKIVCSTIA